MVKIAAMIAHMLGYKSGHSSASLYLLCPLISFDHQFHLHLNFTQYSLGLHYHHPSQ